MTTRTSKLKAINPEKWGYRKVDIYFGQVRESKDQKWVLSGELIRDRRGRVWEFAYREGESIRGYPVELQRSFKKG
jgi:hypothetical protein